MMLSLKRLTLLGFSLLVAFGINISLRGAAEMLKPVLFWRQAVGLSKGQWYRES
jgi:hypothetical protein